MSELERDLRDLAAELRWPETPTLAVRLEPRTRRPRRLLLAVAVAVLVAIAVALSVPSARSAILRVFRLGGVSVERVNTLPATPSRPLTAGLGPVVTRERAAAALALPAARLPHGDLRLEGGVVSVVLRGRLLLSALRTGPIPVLQKELAGSGTHATWSVLNGQPALWIAGARHLVRFPDAPPRLAGNVLVWQVGPITYRLEGASLTRAQALAFARGT
jgi:hypothetical protein